MRETELFARLRSHGARPALCDPPDAWWTYAELPAAADRVAASLLGDRADLAGARVAHLIPPSRAWAAVTLGIWRAGGVAVPLALAHPPPELAYALDDSGAEHVVASSELADRLHGLVAERGLAFDLVDDLLAEPCERSTWPEVDAARGALLIYTSGTTGRPKGVLLSHANLEAQILNLIDAWEWTSDDRIVEFLPLHHVHGIVNILLCGLWAGARVELMPRFDAEAVWRRIGSGELTSLMAVPTIYRRLITAWEEQDQPRRAELSAACREMRLMVSGSAALPVPTLERWREISGHVLLERYGMSEIGMALSNPLHGERVPGAVGEPLPRIEVRLVGDDGRELTASSADGIVGPGEIEVRGPTVFREYLGRPEATRDAFRTADDGGAAWFRTGDTATRDAQGVYRILGRQSVDILKTGGEKVSALEIEAVLREHPSVADCAVVGVPDPEWGQCVAAAVVCAPGAELELEAMRDFLRARLAIYKVPSRLLCVEDLPRNAMGKVQKPAVTALFG